MSDLIKHLSKFTNQLEMHSLGVALSGGGDSLALCITLKNAKIPFKALHFNHHLRPEADAEAAWLEKLCKERHIPFYSQTWQSPKSTKGNIQQLARRARYAFLNDAAKKLEIKHIFTAHTADDVVETTLMRLFYGSGSQGLAKMRQKVRKNSYTLHRPLLDFSREDLRTYLQKNHQIWLEDPSNYNTDYVRVRARYWLKEMPNDIQSALLELAEGCAQLEEALKTQLLPYKDYIVKNKNNWAVINSAVLSLPDYARHRLFKDVFQTLQPQRHLPRPEKQKRLFSVLECENAHHHVGQIQFERQGQKIVAKPKNE